MKYRSLVVASLVFASTSVAAQAPKATISKDGKWMTFFAKTLNPQGQWIEATAVFDKV